MAKLETVSEKRGATVYWFKPEQLKIVPGLNARDLNTPEVQAHIDWLMENIAVEGVKKPLEVFTKGEDVFVSDGECRLTAVLKLIATGVDIPMVPCISEPKGVSEAHRLLNQNLSNSGLRLTALEEGRNIQRANAMGLSVSDIARKLGRSVSHVTEALNFQGAAPVIHNWVKEGAVSASLAKKVSREEGDAAPEVLKQAKKAAEARGSTRIRPRDLPARPSTGGKSATPKSTFIEGFEAKHVSVKQASATEVSVTIKDTIILAKKEAWLEICDKILDLSEPPRETAA